MKRTFGQRLFAGLLLATTNYVCAQENALKFFGELDIALMRSKSSNGLSAMSLDAGVFQQSHFGLELSERLNHDYHLAVRLDSFVNVDTGSTVPNTIWSRESSLSIKNQNWRFSVGKNLSPIFDHAVSFNSFNNSRLAPLFSVVAFATTHPLNPAQDNSLKIDWQADQNWLASYLYRVSEGANSMYWTAALSYQQSSDSFGLAIDHSAPLGGQGGLYSVLASASHQFTQAKLYANLLAQKDTNLQQRSWGGEFGLIAPVTGGNVKFSYAKGSKSPIYKGSLAQIKTTAAAYEYLLSKRSSWYVIAQLQQRDLAPNTHSVALGLTHKF